MLQSGIGILSMLDERVCWSSKRYPVFVDGESSQDLIPRDGMTAAADSSELSAVNR